MSDNALRRAGMAMLAIGLAVSLTACTPPNGAVGDTQSQDSAVAHVGPDRAALQGAREAGIAVALLNPVHVPKDGKLYAAVLTINDRMADAVPIADAVMTIGNNDPHERDMVVTTK